MLFEDFTGDEAVLSKDNLKIAFKVHTVWRVDESRVPLFMERFSTTMIKGSAEKVSDAIVKAAYGHFVREPLRTFARDEVQQRNGLEVKDALIAIGDSVLRRIRRLGHAESAVGRESAIPSGRPETEPYTSCTIPPN